MHMIEEHMARQLEWRSEEPFGTLDPLTTGVSPACDRITAAASARR
jgi:thiamine biosynthesis protein ThiC